MNSRLKKCAPLLAIATMLFGVEISARAQDKAHVVSLADLNKDSAQAAQTRHADEDAVRTLFSSEPGQKAMKSAHLDYEKVDKAVSQLSDEDLAKLAGRSRQAQADFAAGRISNGAIVAIIVLIAATIILVTVFVQLKHS
jgi:Flp pilus assembly protein TadB